MNCVSKNGCYLFLIHEIHIWFDICIFIDVLASFFSQRLNRIDKIFFCEKLGYCCRNKRLTEVYSTRILCFKYFVSVFRFFANLV